MVYVRSVKSIQIFPRVTLSLFLLFHFYMYLHPTGFHLLALWVFFLFELLLMLFCLSQYEIPAFASGEVSEQCPRYVFILAARILHLNPRTVFSSSYFLLRALHNSLPWPTWAVALAPDYSLFLPVTHRAMDIYGAPSGMPTNQHNADGGNATARTENNIRNEQPVESDVTGNPLHRHSDRSAGDHRLSDIEMGSTDRTRLAPIAIGNSAPAAVASQRQGSSC